MGQKPEDRCQTGDEGEAQTVADIHGAEKISGLAIEEKIADGAAIIHLGEPPINAAVHAPVNVWPENFARPASRTELAEDAVEGGWAGTMHGHHDSGWLSS